MIAEPTSALGLWPQVRGASSFGWPTSDEDRARSLAERWRTAARDFTDAAAFDTGPVAGAWPDSAGEGFAGRVRAELESALTAGDGMQSLADRVDHFADVVIGVKNAIRTLIEINLDGYAATRHLAPEDRESVRADFVTRLAAELDRIVATGVSQLGGPPPVPEPPPAPEPGVGEQLGDLAADVGARVNAFGNAVLDRPDLVLALAGGAALTGFGAAGVLGGGGLAATGVGAVPGAAVVAGSYALAGAGAVGTAAAWEALMVEARTQDGGIGSANPTTQEGYRSSPGLQGDPYHPDAVAERIRLNREVYGPTTDDRAAELGYGRRIAPQKAPFNSMGQPVFFDGRNYITRDITGHNVTDGWKMFNLRGERTGTYDPTLQTRIKD